MFLTRYEIQYRVRFDGNVWNGSVHYCNLSLVEEGNQASILFGNTANTACQIGSILHKDVNSTNAHESLAAGSCSHVYSTNWAGGVTAGIYTYRLVFETFADNNIKDKVYYSVTNGNKTGSLQADLNSGHFGFGGDTSKVFDDIGFHIKGASDTNATKTVGNQIGGTLLTNDATFTKYSRTDTPVTNEPNVPDPSAFGLLAGLGAIALAASRRRRSR